MEGKRHKVLVAQIVANPDILEPGLVLKGQNVLVSQDFGEQGFIDLLFEDRKARWLLVEVKSGPDELDKAIGQVLRHRHLFARQNGLSKDTIRIAVCSPFVPAHSRSICEESGIQWFEVTLRPRVLT